MRIRTLQFQISKLIPNLILFGICVLPVAAWAQSGKPKTAPASESAPKNTEPYLIEMYSTKVRFANDGTGERELSVRIKIQTDEGAEALRSLTFDFNSASDTFALQSLTVTKPDGSIIRAKSDALQLQPAPIVKSAPLYSEIQQAHIAVPPLKPGDLLQYEVAVRTEHPASPGEFWYSHNFLIEPRLLHEDLQISVPASRKIHLHYAAEFPPTIAHSGSQTIYSWKRSSGENKQKKEPAADESGIQEKPPDVELSSFADWVAVGKWFAGLESKTATPTPQIRAKAQQLVSGAKTDGAKIEALYDFVSKQIRLSQIPLDEIHFVPREPAKILENGSGDEIDKCTLLAAFLDSVNLHGDIALLTSGKTLSAEIPTPDAIRHAVLVVRNGDEVWWMDPSTAAMPFRLLTPNLRGKQAIVASTTTAPHIAESPIDPPFLSTQRVTITGEVNSLGQLSAHVRYVLRGDNEYALRMAFRSTPESQWTRVAQTMAALDGLRGTVANAKPSDPTATRDPFVLNFDISDPNFLDWSEKQTFLPLPLPAFGLPDPPKNAAMPVELGSPLDVETRLELKLPANDSIEVPIGAAVTRDFAEYKASYVWKNHVLTADRTMRFREHELPASRAAEYSAFARAVETDQGQELTVTNSSPGVPAGATASELAESGAAELKSQHFQSAEQLFERAANLDPKQKDIWRNLGLAQLERAEYDKAADSFRKQLEQNPADDSANNLLGIAFYDEKKFDDAAAAFQKQIALKPLDPNAHAYLGAVYIEKNAFESAVSELEKAAVLNPDNAAIRLRLGQAYLGLGKTDPALAAFERAASMAPSAAMSNQIAFDLADHDVALDRAARFAESAVEETEKDLSALDLRNLSTKELGEEADLAAYWDTLGWVDFRQGHLEKAQSLVGAAWRLEQAGLAGDHLAQIYEKRGEKGDAIETYAMAMAAGGAPEATRSRLAALLGVESEIDSRVHLAKAKLTHLRTVALGKSADEGKAEFLVLLEPGANGPVTAEAKFLAGDDAVAHEGALLRDAKFPDVLPAGTKARLILRGTLSCSKKSASCEFVFDRPSDLITSH
jgi:tetratricopeptide (TPR) repeat protein